MLVLAGLKSDQDFLAELERHLSREDQANDWRVSAERIQEAIRTKDALLEMPTEVLEMAWGFPESKRIELVGTQRKESWRWAEGMRTATVVDGRLTAFTGANAASSASSP